MTLLHIHKVYDPIGSLFWQLFYPKFHKLILKWYAFRKKKNKHFDQNNPKGPFCVTQLNCVKSLQDSILSILPQNLCMFNGKTILSDFKLILTYYFLLQLKDEVKDISPFHQLVSKYLSTNTLHSVCCWLQDLVSVEVPSPQNGTDGTPGYLYRYCSYPLTVLCLWDVVTKVWFCQWVLARAVISHSSCSKRDRHQPIQFFSPSSNLVLMLLMKKKLHQKEFCWTKKLILS